MTLYKPTIQVRRLVVLRHSRIVIDIEFHTGLNIIAGENSSGKTTIVRFIAHALGADLIGFNQYARLCDQVLLEVQATDTIVTLQRPVTSASQLPMSIFWGTLELALASAITESWQTFPFRRSESKDSFSQVLFNLLEMPQLRAESGSNITMHQLLRLIYSDQETPAADLFRAERFDPAITRDAVGNYLLGVDSDNLYELKLQQSSLDKELQELRGEARAIARTFGMSGSEISLEFLETRITELASELSQSKDALANLESTSAKMPDVSSTQVDTELREQLSELHKTLSQLKDANLQIEQELADSELFLAELQERLKSLDESMAAESALGTAVFKLCPSCLHPIDTDALKSGTCALCKEPVEPHSAKSQLARMKIELILQQKESDAIRARQLEERDRNIAQIPTLEFKLHEMQAQFDQNATRWRSPYELEAQRLSRQIGGLEQNMLHMIELRKLANVLTENERRIAALENSLASLNGKIDAVTREQDARRRASHLLVSECLGDLLRRDLERQAEFQSASEIIIDFAANRITIDAHQSFSASSMVYLKLSFHLALLLASTINPLFRYPRFSLLDGIEDGGMERDRSYNLQRVIRDKSTECKVTHQIILATSHVCPDLDLPVYMVGRKYSHDHKSIDISS